MKPCFCGYVATINVVLGIEMNSHCNVGALHTRRRYMIMAMVCFYSKKKINTKSTSQDLFYTSSFDILFLICLFSICINMAKIGNFLHSSLLPENMGGMNDSRCNQKYQGNSFVSLINILFAFYSYFKRIVWKIQSRKKDAEWNILVSNISK